MIHFIYHFIVKIKKRKICFNWEAKIRISLDFAKKRRQAKCKLKTSNSNLDQAHYTENDCLYISLRQLDEEDILPCVSKPFGT